METAIAKLIETVGKLWDWFCGLWDVIKSWILDTCYAVVDTILKWASDAIKAIPVPDSWSQGAGFWGHVPSTALWILGELHFGLILSIILGAYTVRFLLNLIPSWATRV